MRRLKRAIGRLLGRGAGPAAASATASLKQGFKRQMAGELAEFLARGRRFDFTPAASPEISILLVLYNQAELTFACLGSLIETMDVPAQLIIVDNASTDDTGRLLERIDGAIILRNAENLHFLRAVNQGAAEASAEALLLLNNDSRVKPGALSAALALLRRAADVGAVGGKIILLDGMLQEAGSIIWRDGSCAGYGRGADPATPEFQFRRAVDYCSGAFLMIRRSLFEALGGLDPAFAPAYYEETDFCMRLRAAGYRVLYEPAVEITHFEFGSAASSEQALALQRRNQLSFVERHRAVLEQSHLPPGSAPLEARTAGRQRRILFIDDRVPFASLGSGFPRARLLLQALADDAFVTFYPLRLPGGDWTEIRAGFAAEIEFMLGSGTPGLPRFLAERAGYYDTILVSRPHNMRIFADSWLKLRARMPNTRLVYDAEAVTAPREAARQTLLGQPPTPGESQRLLAGEMELARLADTVVAVSPPEAAIFAAAGISDIRVLGHALAPAPGPAPFEARRDLLFVGALDDDASPNVDGVLWFVAEIMPRLDRLIGTDWRLVLAGSAGAARIQALAGPRIDLLGRVEDLARSFDRARISLAPARFAAGIPHKVHEAAAHGVPVVATPLLAQQLGWSDGIDLLAAADPAGFAERCAALYRDRVLWQGLRDAALARITVDCSETAFRRVVRQLVSEGAAPA